MRLKTPVRGKGSAGTRRRKSSPGRASPSPGRASPSVPAAVAWKYLTARDVMRAPLVTIPLGARLAEVEQTFAENRITGAPVVDSQDRIVGVVSVRDLIELYAEEPASRPLKGPSFFEASTESLDDQDLETFEVPADSEVTAADAMTAHVFSVPPTASLDEVARRMTQHRIHRILVEDEGHHVGIIGTFDLLEVLANRVA